MVYIHFKTNISQFYGNLKGVFDEGIYKKQINMNQVGWKVMYVNSTNVSMLGRDFDILQFPQFYDRNQKIKCYRFRMWEVTRVKRLAYF